jgi:hypothetical protein
MKLHELMVYHGTDKAHTTKLIPPIFVTTDYEGAKWYAKNMGDDNDGHIITGELLAKHPLDIRGEEGYKKLIALARSANIQVYEDPYFDAPEIADHSEYDGSNPNDLVYVPKFVQALKAAGYDSVHCDDQLSNGDIDTYVLFDPKLFKIIKN